MLLHVLHSVIVFYCVHSNEIDPSVEEMHAEQDEEDDREVRRVWN